MPKNTFFNLSAKKRKKILKTLIKYFGKNPYDKVDIDDVAKECKVSKGSMYQYFVNKKDMYFYAIKEAIKKMFEISKKIDFEKINVFDYLIESFESNWKLFLEYPDEYLLLERALFGFDIQFKEEINKLFLNKFRESLKLIIEKNQKNGFVRDDIPIDLILIFMEGAVMNFKKYIIDYALNKGISSKELPVSFLKELQNYFVKLLRNGLSK
ncbi:MAG: TetR/AcrR family transcriptional regulator [Caldisericia bacterium]|nr:TetR/AcrR family transcriptional regulator [Caldisericia bacterium]